jgi:exopolysaccharide biosynthesis polyprenyl glycosylphosphotransferase
MSAVAHGEALSSTNVDERTLAILDHRRRARPFRSRGALIRRLLLAADVIGLSLAFTLTEVLVGGGSSEGIATANEFLVFFATLPAWIFLARLYRLYDHDEERTEHTTADDVVGVFHLVTVITWALWMIGAATHVVHADARKTALFWAFALALVTTGRIVARSAARLSLSYIQNCIIVGAGDVGQLLGRKILHHPEYGINLVGFVDPDPKEQRVELQHVRILGSPDRLPELVALLDVERVIVAFSKEPTSDVIRTVRALREFDVQVDIVPRLFDVVGPRAEVTSIEGMQLIGLPSVHMSKPARAAKRCFDVAGSLVLLVLTAPFLAYAAWRITRESRGPVFFRQTRLGMNQTPFTALKFRTMKEGTSPDEHRAYISAALDAKASPQSNGLYKLERSDAVTRFGRWLRRTGLDELPQLVNVLRGDMSLVGPRPCIPYETENFEPHHFERFLVPAGITGLWQVKARARATFGEALEMDVVYARSWSFGLDIKLLLLTPMELLTRRATR